MGKPGKQESKLVFYSNKLGELVLVNLMLLIACIPIVTLVPAVSAMHYVLLKILRNEESGVIRAFWKSFRENLKQGLVLSLFYLVLFIGQGAFYWIAYCGSVEFDVLTLIAAAILTLITLVSFQWGCILLSRYESSIVRTIRNGFRIAVGKPLSSILITILGVTPFLGIVFLPRLLPIMLFLSFAVCGILQTMVYQHIFELIEER